MSIQKIIITFFIVFFLLFFVLNSTYFGVKNSNSLDQKIFSNIDIGYQEIIDSSTGVFLSEIKKEIDFDDNKIYVDNFDYLDKLYFYTKNYSKKEINGVKTFFIGSGGLYIFDLYNLTNQFEINGDYFKIIPNSPGRFFIDNRNPQNIKIFSFDSIFDVSLLYSGQEMTNIPMYPRMYFGFNSSRNKFLKNADLFRIETISNIFYVSKDLLGNDNKINYGFLNKLYNYYDKDAFSFLSVFIKLLYSEEEINKHDELKISLVENVRLSGLDYINKYFLLFLNDKKKVAFYKKNILDNLNALFKKNGVFDKKSVLLGLQELKKLDEKEYNDFKKVFYYYYDNLLKVNSLGYIDKIFIFSEIIREVEGINKYSLLKSSFFLNKLYSLVNNKTYNNDYLRANFLEFLEYYLDENKIDITGNYNVKLKNEKIILRMDYLSFFVKNMLLYNLNLSDGKSLENVLNVLKKYNNLNLVINKLKNYEKSETLIIENSLLIDKILYEIRKNFFERRLNKSGLLVLSKDNEISSKNLVALDKVMNMFFDFYSSKKGMLSEKNQIYNDIYAKNIEKYRQFYDALNNYPEYLIKYDKLSSNLLSTKTIIENDTKVELSKENLISYLSNFEGIKLSNVGFEIVNNTYYKINDLNINGELFSFDLYPFEFNRISNMVKNGQKLSLSYELDNIKYDWDKRYKEASPEEKDKFDFRKFFMNTFFNNNIAQKKDFVFEDNPVEAEDKVISIFKRDKLLGDKGEFSLLKGYLELKYNNVKVTLNNGVYDIKLENAILRTRVNVDGEWIDIIALLNGEYVFNDKDHYFKNINFKFYNFDTFNTGSQEFLFDGKIFYIDKNINIVDFKNEMDNILGQYFLNARKNG